MIAPCEPKWRRQRLITGKNSHGPKTLTATVALSWCVPEPLDTLAVLRIGAQPRRPCFARTRKLSTVEL